MASEEIKNDQKTLKEMNFKQKCIFIKDQITIEPLLISFTIPEVLCRLLLLNLEYEKSCKANSGFEDAICDSIISGGNNYTNEKHEVQKHIANVHSVSLPIRSVISITLILFFGSYSDRYKLRKPFLIIPVIGDLILISGYAVFAKFMRELRLEYLAAFQTLISPFGGHMMVVTTAFAYMADISKEKSRTFRFGITQILVHICTPITQSFTAIMFNSIGYFGCLLICGIIYILGLFYAIFILKESCEPIPRDKTKPILLDLFDARNIGDTFKLLVTKSKENKRVLIIILMVLGFLMVGAMAGELSINFLYVQAIYNWTVVEFFYFLTFVNGSHIAGAMIAVPLFTKVFKFSDYTIVTLCFIAKILTNIIIVSSDKEIALYIANMVSIFIGVLPVTTRSIASKIVSKDDMGKAQTLFSISESIGAAILVPIYNQIYAFMVNIYPATYLLVTIGIRIICIGLTLSMAFISVKYNKKEKEEEKNGDIVDMSKF